jgi:signal transduction histidine kinase
MLFIANFLKAQEKVSELLIIAESKTNLDSAIALYNKAYTIATTENNQNLIDSIYFLKSRKYISIGQLDTARVLAKKGLNSYSNPDKNPMAPGLYNLIAATYHHQNTLDTASIYYLKAIRILELKKDTLKTARLRFNLANIYLSYKDYEQASEEFKQTIDVMKRYKDSSLLAGSLSALATCKMDMNDIVSAKSLTNEALKISIIRNDLLGKMLAYRQYGQIAEKEKLLDSSLVYFNKAYNIALLIKHPYYISMIEMNLCETYTDLGNAKKALFFCKKSLNATKSNQFSSHLKSLYTNLSKSYELNNDYKNALLYVNKANRITEKDLNKKNKEIVNELIIKYETEQKDKQILKQKLSISAKERQNYIYTSLIFIAILVIGILILLYYYQNKLNKSKINQINQEKERDVLKAILSGEENERNRLAVDLHDGISNLLFSCKLSLSAIESEDPMIKIKIEENIELIDTIRTESRRMAHNLMPPNFTSEDLENIFEEYIQRVKNATSLTTINFQSFGQNSSCINNDIKLILFRAIQELIGNSLKYAEASEIDLQLFYHTNDVSITVEDNGKGFDSKKESSKSKGLHSLKSRLSSIQATMEIDSVAEKGTTITLNIPH